MPVGTPPGLPASSCNQPVFDPGIGPAHRDAASGTHDLGMETYLLAAYRGKEVELVFGSGYRILS